GERARTGGGGDDGLVSLAEAVRVRGRGRERGRRVPADSQGRLRADKLPPLSSTSIVCIQAGNVNTGAFDPAQAICARARDAGAWVHVDGAFGIWAAAAPRRRHLAAGLERPASGATPRPTVATAPSRS